MKPSPNFKLLTEQFLEALSGDDNAHYDLLLTDSALMRVWTGRGAEVFRPRSHIADYLIKEWAAWPDPKVELLSSVASDRSIAFELRIQATEGERYVEHNRAAFLKVHDGLISEIDLYCPAPIPSARRKGWKAPATISTPDLDRLFDSEFFRYDIRIGVPLPTIGSLDLQRTIIGSGDPHPGSNYVLGARWSADQADQEIEAILAHHKSQNLGFSWLVNSYDSPTDLGERLEQYGMVLAGSTKVMALIGLDNLVVPTNQEIEIKVIELEDKTAIEAGIRIMGICFNMTEDQVARTRTLWHERMSDPAKRSLEIRYLAYLHGVPVGYARLVKDSATALLGGGATLPAYRGQKVYSTLLRRRLEDAREHGYQIATIDAAPMSSRVVTRYGFEAIGKTDIYAWMPEIDMDVIQSLVPQD